jgi:hypothetical protein
MCGRVHLSSDVSEIKLVFSIPPHRPTPNIAPSWNVAPTDPVPIVRYDGCVGRGGLLAAPVYAGCSRLLDVVPPPCEGTHTGLLPRKPISMSENHVFERFVLRACHVIHKLPSQRIVAVDNCGLQLTRQFTLIHFRQNLKSA